MRSVGLRVIALLMLALPAAGANAALIKIDFSCIELSDGVVGWAGPGPMPTCVDLSFTVDTLSYTSALLRYYPGSGFVYDPGQLDQYRFSGVNVLAAVATADGTELPINAPATVEFGCDMNPPGGFGFCYGAFFSYDAVVPPGPQLGDDPLAAILLAQSGAYSFAGAAGDWGYFNAFGSLHMSAVPVPPTAWLLGTGLAGLGGRRLMRRKISS